MGGPSVPSAATCLSGKGGAVSGEKTAGGSVSGLGQPLQPACDTGAAVSEGPHRHTWPPASGLHPVPVQLKTRPYGRCSFLGEKRGGQSHHDSGGKVTGERLAASRTQSPGTYPQATGVASILLTTHLLSLSACPPPPPPMTCGHTKSDSHSLPVY